MVIPKRKIKITAKCLLCFLVPIIAVLYLYPIEEKVVHNGKKYQQADFKIENLFESTKKPTLRTLIAHIFSPPLPLFLDWYKVIITNNVAPNPDCLSEDDFSRIFLEFQKGDPRIYYSTLKETTKESGGYSTDEPGYPTYYINAGETSFFIAQSLENYSINGGFILSACTRSPKTTSGKLQALADLYNMPEWDYTISIRPFWFSYITKAIIIIIFWMFVLSSFLSIKNWIKE